MSALSEMISRLMVGDYSRHPSHGFVRYSNEFRDVYVVKKNMIVIIDKAAKKTLLFNSIRSAVDHCECRGFNDYKDVRRRRRNSLS